MSVGFVGRWWSYSDLLFVLFSDVYCCNGLLGGLDAVQVVQQRLERRRDGAERRRREQRVDGEVLHEVHHVVDLLRAGRQRGAGVEAKADAELVGIVEDGCLVVIALRSSTAFLSSSSDSSIVWQGVHSKLEW